MTELWVCPRGHRWQHPTTIGTPESIRADCPVCGAQGAPTLNEAGPDAPTRQIAPSQSQPSVNDVTLMPPVDKSPTHHDQTLIGSSNAARGLNSNSAVDLADGTIITAESSQPGRLPTGRDTDQIHVPVDSSDATRAGSSWSGTGPSRDWAKPAIPGYEILSTLGRGAMGVVYKARQTRLNRIVALKMILSGEHAGEEDFFRFKTEAQSVAELQHPNIVQIYEVGEADGRPYFSLEYVDGGGLDQKIGGKPLPVLEAARIVEALARAMHLAHQRGILHRDLKSANVLVTKVGVPKITDFGLAKRLDQDSGRTGSGSILGTPSYMAPEQAMGKTRELGPGVDIYALGAILYDCLTGRPPFSGESILDTLMQVEENDPVPPAHLQPKVPPDLETICLKCLQKDPQRRYPTAEALADDIARFQRGEPIHARPITVWERMAKWARRRPALAAAICFFTIIVLSLIVLPIVWLQWETQLRNQAVEEAEKAKQAKAEAEKQTGIAIAAEKYATSARIKSDRTRYAGGMNLAHEAFREGRIPTFREFLNPDANKELAPYRKFEWGYLERLSKLQLAELRGHVQGVQRIVFRPPFVQQLASASADGTIVLWDPEKTNPVLHILRKHTSAVSQLAFSPDGLQMASAGQDGFIHLWDLKDGKVLKTWNESTSGRLHSHGISSLAFSSDGARLASGGDDGTLGVWAIKSTEPLAKLAGHTYAVTDLAFAPRDNNRLASIGDDRKLRYWDINAKEQIGTDSFTRWLTSVAFSPTGNYIAVAGWDRQVHLKDTKAGTIFTLANVTVPVKKLGFGPDSIVPMLAVELQDGSVEVWNIETRKLINTFPKEEGIVRSVAFSSDGQQIASVNFNRLVREYLKYSNPQSALSLCATADPRTFLVGGTEGGLFRWDLEKKTFQSLVGHKGPVRALAHAGNTYFSGDEDGVILRWDAGMDWQKNKVGKLDYRIVALAAHPDGKQVVASQQKPGLDRDKENKGSSDDKLQSLFLLDPANADAAPRQLTGHDDLVQALAYSQDGNFLFSGDAGGRLVIRDRAGKMLSEKELKTAIQSLTCTSVTLKTSNVEENSTWLAAGLEDNSIHLFFVDAKGKWTAHNAPLKGHSGAITCLAFTPDGSRLVSGSEDRMVKIWDPQSGQEILTFKGHTQKVVGLAFSPDGRRLLSADLSGTLLRWETEK